MQIKKITDKNGLPYKTKLNKTLFECKFEAGDQFIPLDKKIINKTYKNITNSYLICRVKDKNNTKITLSKEDDQLFVKLTPNQAKQLQFYNNKNIDITQVLFFCYDYISKQNNTEKYIGIKNKSPLYLEPKNFEDFD